MSKEELITQVLNTTNADLYNFFAKKLLTEYPEYKQKIKNCWVGYEKADISRVLTASDNSLYNGELFHYTYSDNLEELYFLNWVLRNE